MVAIQFKNCMLGDISVCWVDPASKQERLLGFVAAPPRDPGLSRGVPDFITVEALPGTEWCIRGAFDRAGGVIQRYVTAAAPPLQVVSIIGGEYYIPPPPYYIPPLPWEVPVADPTLPAVTPVTPITPIITPGVVITGTPQPVSVGPITPPQPSVVGARDSIFTAPRESQSFDMNVINLEYAIRQQSGLTDKNQLRAAIYAKFSRDC
jgi:hypothetical protein